MMILYLCFAVCAVVGMFLFSENLLVGILLLAVSAAGIILRLLRVGRWKNVVCMALAVVCFVLCLAPVGGADASVTEDYDSRIDQALSALSAQNYDKAENIVQELEETYGVSDDLLFVKAEFEIDEKDYSAAAEIMKTMEVQNTDRWYSVMETIYLAENTDESSASLKEMYLAAADQLPEVSHWQFMAGLVRLDETAAASAQYYLTRAWTLDDSDPETAYYLGVSCYQQQDYDTAKYYFNEALKLGADKDIQQQIKWYGEQMGSES